MENLLSHFNKILINKLNLNKIFYLNILICFSSFFLGRISIFNVLNPISIGFLSYILFKEPYIYLSLILSLFGFLSNTKSIYISKYIICLCLLTFSNFIFNTKKINNIFFKSLLASSCIIISGIISMILKNFPTYYLFLSLVEGLSTFLIGTIFNKSFENFNFEKNNDFNIENIISISILVGSILAGSVNLFFKDLSLTYFLTILVLLIGYYVLDSAFSIIFSTFSLCILVISNIYNSEILLILIVSSILTTILNKKKKLSTVFYFDLSFFILTYFINKNFIDTRIILALTVANCIFLIMPLKNFKSKINYFETNLNHNYVEKLKIATSSKLQKYANSFEKLSKIFISLSDKKENLSQVDIANLIDTVVAKSCTDCTLKKFCWENNFYSTYQAIFTVLNNYEKSGTIDKKQIPSDFIENCININKFIEVLNKTFEIYKLNIMWKNKIIESRELLGQQLIEVSKIINNLSEEIKVGICFKKELSKQLILLLKKNQIYVEDLIVTQNKLNKLEIILKLETFYIPNICTKKIIPIINNFLNKKMSKNYYECLTTKENNKNICTITLVEEQNFRISTGIAYCTKSLSKVSGDTHSFMKLENGTYLLGLSDGMGSGSEAQAESAASIELFEDFINAGFNKDIAINIINSALFLKSSQENFSTLDICTIDLYSGMCEFIKIGAVSTFLIRNNDIEIIRSYSLPVGILNNIDIEKRKKRLNANDIIVMMTDGVIESKKNVVNKENWILNILKNISSKNPQEIADLIIKNAKENCNNTLTDDMTVIVARLWN